MVVQEAYKWIRRSFCKVKHLGYIWDALLTTWVNLLQVLLSPNLWLRVLSRSDDRGNENIIQWQQNHVYLRVFLSPVVPALQDLARFEKCGKHHTGICTLNLPASLALPPATGNPIQKCFPSLSRNKVLLLCFLASRNRHNMELQTVFPDLLKEKKMHRE